MLNKAVLMGRLTADPELKYTPSNVAVVRFTLAVERNHAPQGEERKADFIDIQAWRQSAEFVSKYFRKGQLVAVEGAIQTDTYTDKDGIKRKKFEIVADRVHFAEGKRDNAQETPPAQQRQAAPPVSQPTQQSYQMSGQPQSAPVSPAPAVQPQNPAGWPAFPGAPMEQAQPQQPVLTPTGWPTMPVYPNGSGWPTAPVDVSADDDMPF
jgi:single-strand DNA-binding protein